MEQDSLPAELWRTTLCQVKRPLHPVSTFTSGNRPGRPYTAQSLREGGRGRRPVISNPETAWSPADRRHRPVWSLHLPQGHGSLLKAMQASVRIAPKLYADGSLLAALDRGNLAAVMHSAGHNPNDGRMRSPHHESRVIRSGFGLPPPQTRSRAVHGTPLQVRRRPVWRLLGARCWPRPHNARRGTFPLEARRLAQALRL